MSAVGTSVPPAKAPGLEEWQTDYARAIPELESLAGYFSTSTELRK
jgi:hypothetical protein